MKISCNVIKDILPLYVEDLASEESRSVVEQHISSCDKCKKELEDMQSTDIPPMDTDIKPLKKARDKMKRKEYQTIIFTTAITLVIVMAIMSFLTAPDYLNDLTTVSILENSDGTVLAYFDERVSGYDINKHYENGGYVYDITTWNSIWSRSFTKSELNSTVLNAGGENVASVYYYHTDGSLNRLIYGRDQNPGGGSMILPRLALGYYLGLAVVIIAICLMVILMFRKNKRLKDIIIKLMFLPISYILGHIVIKGFRTTSYSMLRDFLAILLAMTGIYAAILLGMKIMKKSNKRFQ